MHYIPRTIWVCWIFVLFLNHQAFALNEVRLEHKGEEEVVYYDLYVPESVKGRKAPIIVCVGGLPIIDGKFVHSDSHECWEERWFRFAQENQMVILGLGFLFKDRDWEDKTSYQYPSAWSGAALNKVLENIADDQKLDTRRLYLFGISAGAQFVARYALLFPEKVKAVAAHAAGGYDLPQKRVDTKFLITVGEQDNKEISRVKWAQYFVAGAKEKGIDVRFEIIPGIGHRQTEEQNEMSRQFFEEVKEGN